MAASLAWQEGSPLVPRDAGTAEQGTAWLFFTLLVLAFVAYLSGLLAVRNRRTSLTAVLVVAAAIQLAPLGAPLLLSTDAWTYWEYGWIAKEGYNPYTDRPALFPENPAWNYAGAEWRSETSVYAPVFSLATIPVAAVAGDSADVAAWIFKSLAAAGALLCAWLASRLSRARAFAAVFVGWNPLLAIHLAGGGHNDGWIAALVVGALVLAARRRRQTAGATWALAILLKWVPIIFFALLALESHTLVRRVGYAAFALFGGVLVALSCWRFGIDWIWAFGPLGEHVGGSTGYGLSGRLEQVGVPHNVALVIALTVLLGGMTLLFRRALLGQARMALAACLMLATTPWVAAWYTAWPVPLAAAEDDGRAQLAALALCAYLLPQSVPL